MSARNGRWWDPDIVSRPAVVTRTIVCPTNLLFAIFPGKRNQPESWRSCSQMWWVYHMKQVVESSTRGDCSGCCGELPRAPLRTQALTTLAAGGSQGTDFWRMELPSPGGSLHPMTGQWRIQRPGALSWLEDNSERPPQLPHSLEGLAEVSVCITIQPLSLPSSASLPASQVVFLIALTRKRAAYKSLPPSWLLGNQTKQTKWEKIYPVIYS